MAPTSAVTPNLGMVRSPAATAVVGGAQAGSPHEDHSHDEYGPIQIEKSIA